MKLAFITYEFWPSTPGGAGVLIYHAVRQALADGHEVHLIIDVDDITMRKLSQDVSRLEGSSRLYCHQASSLYSNDQPQMDAFCSEIFFRSYRFSIVARTLHRTYNYDYLEYFDYNGPAYFTLIHRAQRPQEYPNKITVRAHNTIEIISERTGLGVHPHSFFNFAAERQSCYMADAIIVPSMAFFEEEYQRRYAVEHRRAVLGSPYCAPLAQLSYVRQKNDCPVIIFYGRLSTLKGLDTFLTAAEMLIRTSSRNLEFKIIGPVEHVVGNVNEQLARMKELFGSKINIVGPISRDEIPDVMADAACAVFANRSESFCYAAHELYQLGLPLIVNDIPGFRGSFPREGAVEFFDGSAGNLAQKISAVLSDESLQNRLKYRTQEDLERYRGTSYESILPKVQPFTGTYSSDLQHITIVSLSDWRVIGNAWTDMRIPSGLSVDFAVFSQCSKDNRNLRIFSRDLVLDPISTIPSVFSLLPSGNIIFTKDLGSLDLEKIASILRSRPERFTVFDEGVYGASAGPSASTAPDLSDYTVLESDGPRWFAVRNCEIETLFDLQRLFASTTFGRPFTIKNSDPGHHPCVTLPGRTISQDRPDTSLRVDVARPGPVGELIERWRLYSSENPHSVTVANFLNSERSECWVVGVAKNDGQITFRNNPVFMAGDTHVMDNVDVAGRPSTAALVKHGSLSVHNIPRASLTLLKHRHSGEVLVFYRGCCSWVDLFSENAEVVELSLALGSSATELHVTTRKLWPEASLKRSAVSSAATTNIALAARAATLGGEFSLNFSSAEFKFRDSWYVAGFTGDHSLINAPAIQQIFEELRSNDVTTLTCIVTEDSLHLTPAILNAFARAFSSMQFARLILHIDDFHFLSATADRFRDLQVSMKLLAGETRFRLQVHAGSNRLLRYLGLHNVEARLREMAWPEFGSFRPAVSRHDAAVGVFGSPGVVPTCAHMLTAVAASNYVGLIELWNAPATDIELRAIFPKADIVSRRGEPTLVELARYSCVMSVYPEYFSGSLLRNSVGVGVPFVVGVNDEKLLAVSELRMIAVCPFWEDSTDIADHFRLASDAEQFKSAYEIARRRISSI